MEPVEVQFIKELSLSLKTQVKNKATQELIITGLSLVLNYEFKNYRNLKLLLNSPRINLEQKLIQSLIESGCELEEAKKTKAWIIACLIGVAQTSLEAKIFILEEAAQIIKYQQAQEKQEVI